MENAVLLLTSKGSHVAYQEGVAGQNNFLCRVCIDFFEGAMKQKL